MKVRTPTKTETLVSLLSMLWACLMFALAMSSCFVAARSVYTRAPWVEASADTITAVVGKTYKDVVKPINY